MTEDTPITETLTQWSDLLMSRSMRDFQSYARSFGLSMPQVITLYTLRYRESCTMSDIASKLEVSGAAASQMVDRLEEQGLLDRALHPTDRRVRLVRLTDQGRALVERGVEARLSWIKDLAGSLTPEEQEQVGAALAVLVRAASAIAQD